MADETSFLSEALKWQKKYKSKSIEELLRFISVVLANFFLISDRAGLGCALNKGVCEEFLENIIPVGTN